MNDEIVRKNSRAVLEDNKCAPCQSFLCNEPAGNRVIESNSKPATNSGTIYINKEFKILCYLQIELVPVNSNTLCFATS